MVADARFVEQPVDEGQAARLAAQRPAADAVQAEAGIVFRAVEVGDDDLVAFPAIVAEDAHEFVANLLDPAVVGDGHRSQTLGQREFGPRLEPVGEVILAAVKRDGLGGHLGQSLDQILEVVSLADDPAVRHAKDEITETERLLEDATQVVEQDLRTLEQELRVEFGGQAFVFRYARLQHDRNVVALGAHALDQLDACAAVHHAFTRELDVRNDSEDVGVVFLEVAPGLFVRPAE
ncbi:MAG: hypothetical protein GTN89_09355 [Acidobacteria bacterium]|nr:hypothetical protein [Acidobacteriota bacterium]NIQ30560.1 hypothetical protein [Acidobacteriota bacterium]